MSEERKFSFREHGLMLFLGKTEYKAFIKLQADKGLGRSYAGKLAFTEGLFHLGYLDKAEHEQNIKKYSEELREAPKPISFVEAQQKSEAARVEKVLLAALVQWDQLSEKARLYHLATAKKYSSLEISQRLLECVMR